MKLDKLLVVGALMTAGTAFAAGYDQSQTQTPQDQSVGTERQEQVQELGAEHRQSWNRLDANQDGYISREEAAGHLELSDSFQDHDENEDGQLSAEEFSDWDGAHEQSN